MSHSANLLLVDDEPRNLDVLESILTSPEYRLVRAQTADEALLALVDGEFAAIILDIRMPGMSGLELANLIKRRKKTQFIPIIFLTAYYQEDKYVLEGYGVGAVDYLTKPVNPQVLKSKVAVFADMFRSTRALAAANQALALEVIQRQQAEEALRQANAELERRVLERTADVTLANESLGESERHYRELVQGLPAAVYTTDAQGRVDLYNEAAIELWGREPERGKTLWCGSYRTFRPDGSTLPMEESPMAVALREGRAVRGEEIVIERADGSRRNVLPYPEPIRDASGTLVGAVNMLVDLTDRKKAEAVLRESEARLSAASRAKDDFLAALSHELRTPLNPVLLLASEAAEDPTLPEKVRADFANIRHNVELEARLIDDLLDLTRITSGKLGLHLGRVDFHKVLQHAISTVRADMDRKRIELTLTLGATQNHIIGDEVRLQQIFWNLLKNAVKFTPECGRITVETCILPETNTLAVRIIDTGIGMTTQEIERVFNAFSQGDHANGTGSHRFGGMGLGLAIARRLVELHSGAIHADSAGRGKGATFVVKLPITQPVGCEQDSSESDVSLSSARAQAPAGFRRILLVEDHEPTRTALAQILRRRNYDVVTAATVEEAKAMAMEGNIELVISDIGLPDGNGFDLMSHLRDRHQMRGIALTGYGMEQDIARSRAAGFIAHLTKPVRVQSLESVLVSVGKEAAKPAVEGEQR